MKKIYISGKISDLPMTEVIEKFNAAKVLIAALGYEPVSPLDNGCESDHWYDQMMACLPMLRECHGIFMLPDWESSEGAKIELMFARKIGMFEITGGGIRCME